MILGKLSALRWVNATTGTTSRADACASARYFSRPPPTVHTTRHRHKPYPDVRPSSNADAVIGDLGVWHDTGTTPRRDRRNLVFVELDLFWITFAGRGSLDYVPCNERRFPLFHGGFVERRLSRANR